LKKKLKDLDDLEKRDGLHTQKNANKQGETQKKLDDWDLDFIP
jgi:hypothetical protein